MKPGARMLRTRMYHETYENYAAVVALYQNLVREYRQPEVKLVNELN